VAVATEPDPLRAVELEQETVAVGPVAAIDHVGVPVGVIPPVPVTVTVKVSVVPVLEPTTLTVGVNFAIVSVNFWGVALPATFVAFTHTVYVPAEPEPGVPDRAPALVNVMPEGNVDGVHPANAALENVAAGVPVAVVVKLPAVPTVKLVELALVMVGAWSTVRVKFCVPVPTELVTLMQMV